MTCPHYSRARDRGQGRCALGRFDGAPWPGNCQGCLARGENTPEAADAADAPGEWPLLLRPLRLAAQPGDRGLGDIVARTVGPVGGEAFKAFYLRTFGKDCGCTDRQSALNRRYPL